MLIAAALILALGGEGGFFWQRYNLKVKFPERRRRAARLASPRGGRDGRRRDRTCAFVGSDVEMMLELREDMQDKVRTTSRATIGSVSLLGEGAVDITRIDDGRADSRMGVRAVGPAAGAAVGRDRTGEQGIAELTGADRPTSGRAKAPSAS